MTASSRFLLDILFVVGGAFLVVVSMGLAASPAGWVAFGVSTGLAVLAAASVAATRSMSRRIGHGVIGLVALWSLIAALVFAGPALTWLVFADAIGLGALAIGDLFAHEVTTENVVHRLEVSGAPGRASASNGRVSA